MKELKISDRHRDLFTAINNIASIICKETGASELGGAYDLAKYIQLAIYNVFEEDGSMIWKQE